MEGSGRYSESSRGVLAIRWCGGYCSWRESIEIGREGWITRERVDSGGVPWSLHSKWWGGRKGKRRRVGDGSQGRIILGDSRTDRLERGDRTRDNAPTRASSYYGSLRGLIEFCKKKKKKSAAPLKKDSDSLLTVGQSIYLNRLLLNDHIICTHT